MNILLINQFFWPDSAPTSQLLTDLARELSKAGHNIRVVCAGGGYAQDDTSEPPRGVSIQRSAAWKFGRGRGGRVLSYASFLSSAIFSTMFGRRPDLVLTLTTPPLLSALGTMLKLTKGSKHYIWEMDVYPDVAIALDYLKAGGALAKLSRFISDQSHRHADGVLALGDCMRRKLEQNGVPPARIHITENWADGRAIQPQPICSGDKLRLLYSGNLGLAHDVETIWNAMLALRNDTSFEFIFAGGGFHSKPLEIRCHDNEFENAVFRSYAKRADLGSSLSDGDIGLVTQRDVCIGLVVPSKVYGLMAAGRPVLFIGPREATPAQIISRFDCGWQMECGDHAGVIRLLRHLAATPAAVRQAGRNARRAFDEHYDLPMGVARICHVIGAGVPAVRESTLAGAALEGQAAASRV